MERRISVVTGAAGFTGYALVRQLLNKGYEVWAVVRSQSSHNERIMGFEGVKVVEWGAYGASDLTNERGHKTEVSSFFHLAWMPGRSISEQIKNIEFTLSALELAAKLQCKRFICTGSQAEYGIVSPHEVVGENHFANPITAYGASKVAACELTKIRAKELGIDWIWGRIFSLIGYYEPRGRMLPDLFWALQEGKTMKLSSCRQNWDYLDVNDAAEALIALAERGVGGEIYNIANGNYKPLKEYTEELRRIVAPGVPISYGDDPDPFISLQPSVQKIRQDTGWKPKRSFEDSIKDYLNVEENLYK